MLRAGPRCGPPSTQPLPAAMIPNRWRRWGISRTGPPRYLARRPMAGRHVDGLERCRRPWDQSGGAV